MILKEKEKNGRWWESILARIFSANNNSIATTKLNVLMNFFRACVHIRFCHLRGRCELFCFDYTSSSHRSKKSPRSNLDSSAIKNIFSNFLLQMINCNIFWDFENSRNVKDQKTRFIVETRERPTVTANGSHCGRSRNFISISWSTIKKIKNRQAPGKHKEPSKLFDLQSHNCDLLFSEQLKLQLFRHFPFQHHFRFALSLISINAVK